MKSQYLEIIPDHGSHYLISDQGQLARFDNLEIAFEVRRQLIEQGLLERGAA